MAYYNWFNTYFKEKHKNSTTDDKINDVLLMLEHRGSEYLVHNYETYKQLWIDPNEDIVNSKPQIIQQIREELYDFLKLLIDNDVKKVLQIGLGHFGSTHFCLSLICDEVVTVEYDIKNITNPYVEKYIDDTYKGQKIATIPINLIPSTVLEGRVM